MIRSATLEDADWLVDLARLQYPDVAEENIRDWLNGLAVAQSPDIFFIRNDHAALVATLQRPFYAPDKPDVQLLFVMAHPNRDFAGYRLMEAMLDWARSLGASVHFGAQCGADMESIARRLGAVQDEPSWTIGAA